MGFLSDLGIGDIVTSFQEMADEIAGLKDDIVGSIEPVAQLQQIVEDSASIINDSSSEGSSN